MKDRIKFVIVVAVLGMALGSSGVGHAITHGQPDGNGHPYVGAVNNGIFFCSGAAISPFIFVTAAHCFNSPGEQVWITFDFEPFAPGEPEPVYYAGKWYPHPDFCLGCGPGLPGADTNDVAVVVLDERADLPRYAQLPAVGVVDTLPMGTEVTIVGYGAQFFVTGGGPRQPGFLLTRYYAPTKLVTSNHVNSDEFIKLTANPAKGKGGTCFGDSGGPDLLASTDKILAVNSYVTNSNCTGVTYSNRIDTREALEFIRSFLP